MSSVEKLIQRIEESQKFATPGPYYFDCGNGDIESRNEDHYRCSVIDRADSLRRRDHYEQFNLKIKPGEIPCDPNSDMEYFCLLGNAVPLLIEIIKEHQNLIEWAKANHKYGILTAISESEGICEAIAETKFE